MVSNLGSEALAWLDRDESEHSAACFLLCLLRVFAFVRSLQRVKTNSTAADSANKSQMCLEEQLLCLGLLHFSRAEINNRWDVDKV